LWYAYTVAGPDCFDFVSIVQPIHGLTVATGNQMCDGLRSASGNWPKIIRAIVSRASFRSRTNKKVAFYHPFRDV
jgi:hypothetical protein